MAKNYHRSSFPTSGMFRNFPRRRMGQIARGTCYVRPPKRVKTALLWPLGCALPTPIAPSDSPELCVLSSGMAYASGKFPRIERRYAPLRSVVYHIFNKTAQIAIALFATYRAIKTNWWWIGPRASRNLILNMNSFLLKQPHQTF